MIHAIPPGLSAPPGNHPLSPPVETRAQALPFGQLSWENFERLCFRLAAREAAVEHAARYGRAGQAQAGIDIFARYPGGHYHCWQVKRHERFGAADLRKAVDLFLAGEWVDRSSRLTVALQIATDDTKLQKEIEAQAARLKSAGLDFQVLGEGELGDALRAVPEIVDDFFGRAWVTAFLGADAAAALGRRLDGLRFARARDQLRKVYGEQFRLIDPGTFARPNEAGERPELGLLERFLLPDILVANRQAASVRPGQSVQAGEDGAAPAGQDVPQDARPGPMRDAAEPGLSRVTLGEWMGGGDRVVFLGDAGSGKSSLLRCTALDLLADQKKLPMMAERWGGRLPLHLSFSRWSREVARTGAAVGIKDMVRRSLQPLMTTDLVDLVDAAIDEGRVLLLVDGLDEWADEQAARTALSILFASARAHQIPTIVTARPRGFEKIGTVPPGWQTASLAPFSNPQQHALALAWFERFAGGSGADRASIAAERTSRFMAEVARDRSIGALAEIPLLLVGLIMLSLRGQSLPRNKSDALAQLVDLLLEIHPKSRATAAGDSQDRFVHARDPEQRRAALAYLAFVLRSEAGDAGYPLAGARKMIAAYLVSDEGLALPPAEARGMASELLAVNSELQGLVVEKAPQEIGFAHACFEEYLCAEHLAGWSFPELAEFAGRNAGNPRWRNILVLLFAFIRRRDECEALITAIEAQSRDQLGALNSRMLLSEIAFTFPNRAPHTTRRLMDETFREIETGRWKAVRRDMLGSALDAIDDPAIGPAIAGRLATWHPGLSRWRAGLFEELAGWERSPDQFAVLWRGLHDEARWNQRGAAKALAKAYGGCAETGARLRKGLRETQDLQAAAAFLEALQLGWNGDEGLADLFREAAGSDNQALACVGMAALAAAGDRSIPVRDALVRFMAFDFDAQFPDQELARDTIQLCWSGDDELVAAAMDAERERGYPSRSWGRHEAMAFLLTCPAERRDVADWIIGRFKERYPFAIGGAFRAWTEVRRFAAVHPDVREAAIVHLLVEENRRFRTHELVSDLPGFRDDRLRAAFMSDASEANGFDEYWSVMGLLKGWGFGDPVVGPYLNSIAARPDEGLVHLPSLLPDLIADPILCRERLLSLARLPSVRRDLLARGFVALGCDGTDDAAVRAILAESEPHGPAFLGNEVLVEHFSAHPAVRALALDLLHRPSPPLASIAAGFRHDPEIRQLLLNTAAPLPEDLRTGIVEAAIAARSAGALGTILATYRMEHAVDLKVRLCVAHYRQMPGEARDDAIIAALVADAQAVGSDYTNHRTAALAGLLTLGRIDAIRDVPDFEGLLRIVVGDPLERLPALNDVICENWQQLIDCFGATLHERLDTLSGPSALNDALAAACRRSEASRQEFLLRFEEKRLVPTATALRAYAELRPGSDLLLERCLEGLEPQSNDLDTLERCAAIAFLLRSHFAGNAAVAAELRAMLDKSKGLTIGMVLAIVAPDELASLELKLAPIKIGTDHGHWGAALWIGASCLGPEDFAALVEAMIRRDRWLRWHLPEVANRAIVERLQKDGAVSRILRGWIDPDADDLLFANAARYLAQAAPLDAELRDRIGGRLDLLLAHQRLPVAIFDALSHTTRSASASLLHALRGEGP